MQPFVPMPPVGTATIALAPLLTSISWCGTLLDKQSVSIASAVGTFATDSPIWAAAKFAESAVAGPLSTLWEGPSAGRGPAPL